MKNSKIIIAFLAGVLLMLLIFFIINKISKKNEQNDYFILTNQITKMNKLVVLEQNFSTLQKSNVSYEFLGKNISNNQIVTITQTNAQVSYDLNKMKLDIDSVNKKLIIKELPKADIKITPNVKIQSMEDSFFNRINEAQIKKVTKSSEEYALKNVNQEKLRKMGKEQLIDNLNQIFVLAKALNYTIEDKTGQINLLN